MRLRPLLAIVLILSMLLGLQSLALAATDELDQAHTSDGEDVIQAFSNQWLAQTFTAGITGDLTRVKMYIQPAMPMGSGTMTVQLRAVEAGTPTGTHAVNSGTVLASKQYTVSFTAPYWHEVVFDTPAPIVKDTQYAIVLGNSSFDGGIAWVYTNNNQYASGGAFFTTSAGAWNSTDGGNRDHLFETYVVAAVVTDTTAPIITPNVVGTLGNDGWYTSDVTVSWSVVDAESAITSSSGCGATTITSDTTGTTLTCAATSAGGMASQSVTIKRDATKPALAPSVSPNPVLLNGTATASANASDGTSGIATQNCNAVGTSSVGTKTVSCTATDNAGNTSTASVNYQVHYAFSGLQAPVNPDALNVAKAGQSIPLKFHVTDSTGTAVTNLTAVSVTSTSVACGTVNAVSDPVEAYATGKSGLQYLGDGTYQFNWSTEKGWANTCRQLHLSLGDGLTHTANFEFKK
jgi:hypothetical protein